MSLSSCLWTQVSTHTLTDAIGKQEYTERTNHSAVNIYRLNDVYYAQHVFFKVPARGRLCTRSILRKGGCIDHIYLSEKPNYREDTEPCFLYKALTKDVLTKLLPGRRYKEAPAPEQILPQSSFEGLTPVAVISDYRKLAFLSTVDPQSMPPHRNAMNYALMPLTGALYVSDAALSVVVTTAGWVVFNVPLFTLGPLYCWVTKEAF